MFLAIDVGNTHTVIGVYRDADRVAPFRMWRIATNKQDTADDILARTTPLFGASGVCFGDMHAAAIASVVPALAQSWTQAIGDASSAQIFMCSADAAREANLLSESYPNPREIGADRVADAVAARALFGSPVVVVDFGTATNIEVIDKSGCFIGGIIAPGVKTGADALFSHATRLSAVTLASPPEAIGTNTEEAIRSGIVLGEADRVDGLVRRIFKQLGHTAPVVATGGLAELIAKHSAEITDVLPELTLEGLRLLATAALGEGDGIAASGEELSFEPSSV